MLYVPVNNFSVMLGRRIPTEISLFLKENSYLVVFVRFMDRCCGSDWRYIVLFFAILRRTKKKTTMTITMTTRTPNTAPTIAPTFDGSSGTAVINKDLGKNNQRAQLFDHNSKKLDHLNSHCWMYPLVWILYSENRVHLLAILIHCNFLSKHIPADLDLHCFQCMMYLI